jgi:hypothetical protein
LYFSVVHLLDPAGVNSVSLIAGSASVSKDFPDYKKPQCIPDTVFAEQSSDLTAPEESEKLMLLYMI